MESPADLCIFNGRIFDGRARLDHTAVAIKSGRIIAVSDDETVLALAGSGARVIDADGGAILPGFVDAHVHAVFAGVERRSIDLTGASSPEETLELIAEAIGRGIGDEWITGGGWSHELFDHPTADLLDEICSDRPIALSDAGHHTLWVNSLALKLAGIDATTPQPHNGHIHREESGEPTGYLNESAAELVGAIIPPASPDEMYAGLLNAQQHLWSIGVTGWHEAILGDYNGKADCTDAYLRGIAEETVPSRTSGALWIPQGLRAEDVPNLVDDFVRRREQNARAGFPTSTAKAMIDGVPHGRTAALLEPYCSHDEDDDSGAMHFDEPTIAAFVLALDAAGFALHLHIMSDRGIRTALDAIESARRANGPGPRHHIAHLSMVQPDDARRFGPLGVTANMQALWAAPDPHVVPMIGQERMSAGYPFRSLADGGADLAMGSDWPVSPSEPWWAIHVAVNRSLPGNDGVLGEGQGLTLTEALSAYTTGSASLVLGECGRIRVGERADLSVSSQDPFSIPANELIGVSTVATVVGGTVVYETHESV